MSPSEASPARRRIPIAEGDSRDDLDQVRQVFEASGIHIEVQEDLAGEAGGVAWRVLVAPEDALRARIALSAALRRIRQRGRAAAATPAGTPAVPSNKPLFEPRAPGLMRFLIPLIFFLIAAWLAIRGDS
jgi:hypothetical protein